jgi:mannose-6-phosphate isomerase-like protein (cupin superfamily)
MNDLKPYTIALENTGHEFFRILGGEKLTAGMKSGLITLNPDTSVGLHSTDNREEVLLILEGTGEAHIAGFEPLLISPDMAVYIPPHHQHDIKNTGVKCLRYIYVVAPVNGNTAKQAVDT